MLDAKENQLIDYYHNKIVKKVFDEKDIYTFLIILRRHARTKSPVYEFANFVAHRERDRGYFFEYIHDKKYILDRLGKISACIEIKSIFDFDEIKNSFNIIMKQLNKREFSNGDINDITLCIIILLQDVKLVNKKNQQIGKLVIGIDKQKVSLLGRILIENNGHSVPCVFPALEISNIYTKQFNQNETAILKVVVEINRNQSGLGIVCLPENKISNDLEL